MRHETMVNKSEIAYLSYVSCGLTLGKWVSFQQLSSKQLDFGRRSAEHETICWLHNSMERIEQLDMIISLGFCILISSIMIWHFAPGCFWSFSVISLFYTKIWQINQYFLLLGIQIVVWLIQKAVLLAEIVNCISKYCVPVTVHKSHHCMWSTSSSAVQTSSILLLVSSFFSQLFSSCPFWWPAALRFSRGRLFLQLLNNLWSDTFHLAAALLQ